MQDSTSFIIHRDASLSVLGVVRPLSLTNALLGQSKRPLFKSVYNVTLPLLL